jgi:MTH538 TIR-like domain (DUF1863)
MLYRVFICHAYDHRVIYSELVNKLNGAPRFNWRDLSVPYQTRLGSNGSEIDDDQLRAEICRRIAEADVVLALTKPIASRRRWLQFEIAFAQELRRPVIGIARKSNDRVSKFVREHSVDIVDTWRTEHIVNAIRLYVRESPKREAATTIASPLALPAEAPYRLRKGKGTPSFSVRVSGYCR